MKRAASALTIAGLAAAMLLSPGSPAEATSHKVKALGWDFSVKNTATDGLAIVWADYKGSRVFKRISIPQIKVYYSVNPTMNDQIGTGPGVNVPYVPGSLKVGVSGDQIDVRARYQEGDWPDAATYRYDVRYVFYANGQFRTRVYTYGPGLETSHQYEADIRIDLDVAGKNRDLFQHFRTNLWTAPERECNCPSKAPHDDGREWLVFDGQTGRGWRIYPRAGDGDPSLWALTFKDGQGNTDLGTAAANPQSWVNNQRLQHGDIVLWYRSHTFYERGPNCPGTCSSPTVMGPIFRPFGF